MHQLRQAARTLHAKYSNRHNPENNTGVRNVPLPTQSGYATGARAVRNGRDRHLAFNHGNGSLLETSYNIAHPYPGDPINSNIYFISICPPYACYSLTVCGHFVI